MSVHDLTVFFSCMTFVYAVYGTYLKVQAKLRKRKKQ